MASITDMDKLPEKVVHDILNFGLLVMGVSPYKNITMKNLVSILFDGSNETKALIEKVITPAFASVNPEGNVTEALGGLAAYVMTRQPYVNHVHTTNRTFAILTAVTFVFIALRFYSRKYITGRIRIDDWVMLLAFFLSFSYAIVMAMGGIKGWCGLHIWDLSWDMLRANLFWVYISEIWYPAVHIAIKGSILIFYWNLIPNRNFHKAIIATVIFTGIFSIAGFCIIIFQCSPVAFWEDPLVAKCFHRRKVFGAFGWIHIFNDFLILFLPMPVIWKLKMKLREKLIICGMFGFGGFVCIASVNRVIATDRFIEDPDQTYKSPYSAVWGLYEIDFAIIIACIPALKPLLLRYAPKILGTVKGSGSGNMSNSSPPMGATIGGSGGTGIKVAYDVSVETQVSPEDRDASRCQSTTTFVVAEDWRATTPPKSKCSV